MLIRDKNRMRVGIFVSLAENQEECFDYARGINHHVGIWDSHVNLDPRIYCRDDAHHAPAGEPFPLLPRKRFYLGLHAARATRLLSLILFFFPLLRDYMELAGIVLCRWLVSISSPAEHPPPMLSFFIHRDHSCIEYSTRHRIIRDNKLKT